MPISRAEGYYLGSGKEDLSIHLVTEFLSSALNVEAERIMGRAENYTLGDLRCLESQASIEVKGQGIDPNRYPRNFVEVFEDVSEAARAHHATGFAELAVLLMLTEDQLAEIAVKRHDLLGRPIHALGRLSHASVSILSIAGSAATIYVNNNSTMLYFYRSSDLMELIRAAVQAEGLQRGMGLSNADTHAVQLPVAGLRWLRSDGEWQFVGDGPGDGRETARAILGLADRG